MTVDLNVLGQTLNASNDNDLLRGLGMQFGVPECLMNIAIAGGAALFPSQVLGQMASKIQAGRNKANDKISQIKKNILLTLGLWEDDGEGGYVLKSIHSAEGLAGLGEALDAIGTVVGTGAAIYDQYQIAAAEWAAIEDCVNQAALFFKSLGNNTGLSPQQIQQKFAAETAQIFAARSFIERADAALTNIGQVLLDRKLNPDLEPIIIEPTLSAFGKFIAPPVPTDPVFRLVFGPPKSKKGQFLLSVDGLYYDSQKGGVPDVVGFVPPEDYYKFDFPANLGGKGEMISLKKLETYIDTIFDPEVIDESKDIQQHYAADHFLNVLEGQRDKHLYDLSAMIQKAKVQESLTDDSAIIVNMKQSIYSVMAQHQSKINRRKKQIEIAIKSPYLAGTTPAFGLGEVPINDFGHLRDLNVSVAFEKQKKLMFKQGEVSGVVLPIQPRFVKAAEARAAPALNSLIIPPVGKGGIIYDNDSTATEPTILSLTDKVVDDGLFAIYNFLEGEVVSPGSTKYTVLNCNSTNNYNNAQLVALSPSSVFRRGLGIPFLNGIVKLSNSNSQINSLGSFVRLPDTNEFRDYTYKQKGFTFETWVHASGITTSLSDGDPDSAYGVSCLHRLLLACENTGGLVPEVLENPDQAEQSFSSDIVRGLVMGFTRDRQISRGFEPIESTNEAAQSVFFIAPTRSVNGSDVGFINRSSVEECASGYGSLAFSVPLSTSVPNTTKRLRDVSGQFMYYSLAIDPENDQIRLCVDGELVSVASLSYSFGIPAGQSLRVPSFRAANSFEYSTSSTGNSSFSTGPKLNELFTPWILGGGYTDGYRAQNSGFMGQKHGLKSGLNGYLGSTKFYSRPLSASESKQNYDAQKGFFKNIDLS